jgi:hypothetical protein
MDQLADIPPRSAGRAPQILPVRRQAELVAETLRERLDTILPGAMREAGLDVWLILWQPYYLCSSWQVGADRRSR